MSRKSFVIGAVALLTVAALFGCQSAAPLSTSTSEANIESANTATSSPAADSSVETTYNWHGTTLTVSAVLPAGPSEAGVYLAQEREPATLESARALAAQFDMQANLYEAPTDLPNTSGFLIVDGNRRLLIRSNNSFTYYPDHFNYWIATAANANPIDAEEQIDEFMQEFGFGSEYIVAYSEIHGAFYALPLTPDGFPLRHDHFMASGFLFSFTESGIASVDAELLSYEPLGKYAIISANEALQKVLSPDSYYGTLEGFITPSGSPQAWVRTYPQDETITIYGYMNSTASLEGGDPLVSLDSYIVTGNISGISANTQEIFVEATGQFQTDGQTDTFVLESWREFAGGEGILGTLERKGDQVVLVAVDGGELLMPDVPADVPLPLEDVYAMGVTDGDMFEWSAFDLRMLSGGGGGGGGSAGLYSLNLTGTPMPLPTSEAFSSGLPPVGQQLEGQRGMLNVYFYNQPDGSQRVEYMLFYIPEGQQYSIGVVLQGDDLEALQAYHNRPVEIWGAISGEDQRGMAVAGVERFEIPFPDSQIQILRGTQQELQVDGRIATVFTMEDGRNYVQLAPGGDLDGLVLGVEGDEVLLEGLLIPDETFGGYPTIRVFSGSMAVSPKDGQPMTLEIRADQPVVMDELVPQQEYELPTANLEKIELVYYIPDPSFIPNNNDGPGYIQPMWRFTGHYSNGIAFEVLVQALQPEFLSPEIQAVEGPG